MKKIEINGYTLAIFKVEENAIHITVSNESGFISIKEFNLNVQNLLAVINEFSSQMNKLPEEWRERIIKNNQDTSKYQIIIILK